MISKLCAVCGADLAHRQRSDHRYCGVRCRVRAHRLRVAVGIREARRQRRVDREARAKTSRRQATEQTIAELREQLRQEQEANKKLAERVERLKHRLDSAREDHDTAAGEYERRIAKLERQQSGPSNDDELRRVTNQLREANQQITWLKQQRAAAPAAGVSRGASSQREQPAPLVEANRRLRAYAEAREYEVQTLKLELSEAKGKLAKFEALPTREAEFTAEIARLKNALREAQAREHSLQRQNSALRQTADIALDSAAYEQELRKMQGGWIRVAETVGIAILGSAAQKKEKRPATAESATVPPQADPKAPIARTEDAPSRPSETKPPDPVDRDIENRAAWAQRQGWRPNHDPLVTAFREEFVQLDHLARRQQQKGLPVTGCPLPSGADVQKMATHAAFQARWNYFQSPPPERKRRQFWINKHYQLDSHSEGDLRSAVDVRIAKLKTQMGE